MNTVATEMIKYYAGDKKRINHFIKVHGYAKAIGEAEGLDERTMLILETAAYVHDIGIKISEEKYNSSAGKYQEIEGPPIAEEMLTKLRYNKRRYRTCVIPCRSSSHIFKYRRYRLSNTC